MQYNQRIRMRSNNTLEQQDYSRQMGNRARKSRQQQQEELSPRPQQSVPTTADTQFRQNATNSSPYVASGKVPQIAQGRRRRNPNHEQRQQFNGVEEELVIPEDSLSHTNNSKAQRNAQAVNQSNMRHQVNNEEIEIRSAVRLSCLLENGQQSHHTRGASNQYNLGLHDTSQLQEMLVDDNSPDDDSLPSMPQQNYDDAEGLGESDDEKIGIPKINQNESARSHSRNRSRQNFGMQKKNNINGSLKVSNQIIVTDSGDSAVPQSKGNRNHPAISKDNRSHLLKKEVARQDRSEQRKDEAHLHDSQTTVVMGSKVQANSNVAKSRIRGPGNDLQQFRRMHDINQNQNNMISLVQQAGDDGWPHAEENEEDEVVMDDNEYDEQSESVNSERRSTIQNNNFQKQQQIFQPEEVKQTNSQRILETDNSLETGGRMEDDIDEGSVMPQNRASDVSQRDFVKKMKKKIHDSNAFNNNSQLESTVRNFEDSVGSRFSFRKIQGMTSRKKQVHIGGNKAAFAAEEEDDIISADLSETCQQNSLMDGGNEPRHRRKRSKRRQSRYREISSKMKEKTTRDRKKSKVKYIVSSPRKQSDQQEPMIIVAQSSRVHEIAFQSDQKTKASPNDAYDSNNNQDAAVNGDNSCNSTRDWTARKEARQQLRDESKQGQFLSGMSIGVHEQSSIHHQVVQDDSAGNGISIIKELHGSGSLNSSNRDSAVRRKNTLRDIERIMEDPAHEVSKSRSQLLQQTNSIDSGEFTPANTMPRTPLIKKKPMLNQAEELHINKSIEDLVKELEQIQIHCKKYHYTFEPGYQQGDFQDCVLTLEDEGTMLQIQKIDNSSGKVSTIKSFASCKISDVEGFIYGPNSSRFWTMRKHINSVEQCEEYEYPFYAWQCLTLQNQKRDLDLVITNKNHLLLIIHFLVLSLKTVDGQRNSAIPFLNISVIQQMLEEKAAVERSGKVRNVGATYLDDEDIEMLQDIMTSRPLKLEHMYQAHMQKLSLPAYKRFKLLGYRIKISYHAFRRGLTIAELFMRTIMKTYSDRKKQGLIADPWPQIDRKLIKIILMIQNPEQDDDEDVLWKRTIGNDNAGVLTPLNSELIDPVMKRDRNLSPARVSERSHSAKSSIQQTDAVEAKKRQELALMYEQYITQRKKTMASVALNKNKVHEIFKGIFLQLEGSGNSMNDEWIRNEVKFKFRQAMLINSINRIKLIKGLGFPGQTTYVKFSMKIIELERELFALNLMKGYEVKVPNTLDQSNLPVSYRFYDPILFLARGRIQEFRTEFTAFDQNKKGSTSNNKLDRTKSLNTSLVADQRVVGESEEDVNKFNFLNSDKVYETQYSQYIKMVAGVDQDGKPTNQFDFEYLTSGYLHKQKKQNLQAKRFFNQQTTNLRQKGKMLQLLRKCDEDIIHPMRLKLQMRETVTKTFSLDRIKAKIEAKNLATIEDNPHSAQENSQGQGGERHNHAHGEHKEKEHGHAHSHGHGHGPKESHSHGHGHNHEHNHDHGDGSKHVHYQDNSTAMDGLKKVGGGHQHICLGHDIEELIMSELKGKAAKTQKDLEEQLLTVFKERFVDQSQEGSWSMATSKQIKELEAQTQSLANIYYMHNLNKKKKALDQNMKVNGSRNAQGEVVLKTHHFEKQHRIVDNMIEENIMFFAYSQQEREKERRVIKKILQHNDGHVKQRTLAQKQVTQRMQAPLKQANSRGIENEGGRKDLVRKMTSKHLQSTNNTSNPINFVQDGLSNFREKEDPNDTMALSVNLKRRQDRRQLLQKTYSNR